MSSPAKRSSSTVDNAYVDHGVDDACDDDRLAQLVALRDELLLHQCHLLRGHMQAEVASGNDERICRASQVGKVEQGLGVLQLAHELGVVHANLCVRSMVFTITAN